MITPADALRFATSVLICAVIAALVQEVLVTYRVWRPDRTTVALRERIFAASCRLLAAIVAGFLIFNSDYALQLLSRVEIRLVSLVIFLAVGAPAVRFLYLYRHRGFREPK